MYRIDSVIVTLRMARRCGFGNELPGSEFNFGYIKSALSSVGKAPETWSRTLGSISSRGKEWVEINLRSFHTGDRKDSFHVGVYNKIWPIALCPQQSFAKCECFLLPKIQKIISFGIFRGMTLQNCRL